MQQFLRNSTILTALTLTVLISSCSEDEKRILNYQVATTIYTNSSIFEHMDFALEKVDVHGDTACIPFTREMMHTVLWSQLPKEDQSILMEKGAVEWEFLAFDLDSIFIHEGPLALKYKIYASLKNKYQGEYYDWYFNYGVEIKSNITEPVYILKRLTPHIELNTDSSKEERMDPDYIFNDFDFGTLNLKVDKAGGISVLRGKKASTGKR